LPTLKETLQFVMEGGAVTRYHTRPGIKPDTDAHHSWGVATLCIMLGLNSGQPLEALGTLLAAALTHDLGEQVACDISSPAKVALDLGEKLGRIEGHALDQFGLFFEARLTTEERHILKIADCFDGLMYCCREAALGNRNVVIIFERFCTYLEDILSTDFQWEMYHDICDIWREYHGTPHTIVPAGPRFDAFTTIGYPNHKRGKLPADRGPALQGPAAPTP